MNDKVRAEFEEVFPLPSDCEWSEKSNEYCWVGFGVTRRPYDDRWQAWQAAKEKYEPSTQQQEAKPVAVIGDTFSILWIERGPIAPIIERNGLKVGDKLYAHPPKPAAQPPVLVELIKFIEAKEHHLPIEDRHALSVMLSAATEESCQK